MEIKTCEEYVINKLGEQEEELCSLRCELDEAHDRIKGLVKSYNELEDLILELALVTDTAYAKGRYIRFTGIFEEFDQDKFEKITRLVPNILKPKN